MKASVDSRPNLDYTKIHELVLLPHKSPVLKACTISGHHKGLSLCVRSIDLAI